MKSSPSPNRRLHRVAELLKREISDLIRREISIEQVGLLSVHEVQVAPDIRNATVLLGFVGTAAQRRAAPDKIAEKTARIQLLLGSQLRLKWTPILRFVLDDSREKGDRVLSILADLEKESQPGNEAPPAPPDRSTDSVAP